MDNLSLIREKWPDIMNRIKAENDLTDVSYSTWIAPLVPSYADQEGLTLYVPMGNMAINILNKRYTLALRSALSKETGLNLRIHYTDHEEGEESSSPAQEEETEWNDAMDKCRWFQQQVRARSLFSGSGITRRILQSALSLCGRGTRKDTSHAFDRAFRFEK